MSESNSVTDTTARAVELAVLVDLEARWENLRVYPAGTPDTSSTIHELHGKQRAYDVFHTKLVAFNKRFTPAHVPELLLNTPLRLRIWCKKMRDLFVQVEHDSRVPCPLHLVEKAYRGADRIAAKKCQARVGRPAPPSSIPAAVRELEELAHWCDDRSRLEATA
jgi:hypothetical protein